MKALFIHVGKKQFCMDGSADNLTAKSKKCFSLDFIKHGNADCGSK